MSFFKDLFSSISSNKTSEKTSQNTDILTNSAKRVIPSIADCSYRNTGLNNMTFDDLKNLLKNDVFERKLNRAYGDNIAYADMLKKDIVYYYNLMDDLNEHICSILTDRRLLSVDEWMNIFSELQKKNIIHDISNTKNRDILDDYKYIYGNDLVRRLESNYIWMYINSSLLLGCISAIYEKPHFGHDLFDSPSKLVVDEINKCCENWTVYFFSQKYSKINKVNSEDEISCNLDSNTQTVDTYNFENINNDENLTEVEAYSIEDEYKHYESVETNCNEFNTNTVVEEYETFELVESDEVESVEETESIELKSINEAKLSQEDQLPETEADFLSEDAKISISRITEQSFKYTNFSSSTYQDFQDFMKKNVFEKKLNRVDHNILKYTDHLKKNILYYYNLIEDLKCHIQTIITSEQLLDTDEWMDIFAQLQVSNKVNEIEGLKTLIF
ncbi:hypothetical protein [Intestinibacter sp.]